ncbi:DUF6732 family protein [Limimaricola variabilis]|uniref:DUF6732 family protein n=1 Tax=Limimaricola variabilis TaxID=1492771 RepID=UPI002AC8D36A|nr:DUF6732 family protein [Limimaricola variabilis]WPY93837.1 DUF6732 family protein [Limimaricola variabilis]
MRHILLPTIPLIMPGMAAAHPGHMTDLAGHDHWVAGAAIGLAIALGLWGALKGGRSEEKAEGTDEQGDEAKA